MIKASGIARDPETWFFVGFSTMETSYGLSLLVSYSNFITLTVTVLDLFRDY